MVGRFSYIMSVLGHLDNLFFTVINPRAEEDSLEERTILNLDKTEHGYAVNGLEISSQQLGELGVLFIALAGDDFEVDSAAEMLDGFELTINQERLSELWKP